VEEPAALQKILAVVGGQHDDRIVDPVAVFDALPELSDPLVGVSDLFVVHRLDELEVGSRHRLARRHREAPRCDLVGEVARVAIGEADLRVAHIGEVGIEVVHPQEERLAYFAEARQCCHGEISRGHGLVPHNVALVENIKTL